MGIGWRVQGSGFRVRGSGFGLKGSTGSEGSTGGGAAHQKESAAEFENRRCPRSVHEKPLPLGKGPPEGRGIGRQLRKQLLHTYAADYEMGTSRA